MRSVTLHLLATVMWVGILAVPASAQATDGSPKLPMSELEQLLSPIALYPDPLIALILPASTNPLQVVEAARYAVKNPGKKDPPPDVTWDTTIVSLLAFPDVLKKLDEDPAWTQRLGDAVVSQQADVMTAIQNLRKRCQQAGQLGSTEQQKVIVEKETVKIVPADPQVVYVPTYNPATVYAPPPAPPPGPSGKLAGNLLSFGLGVAVGAAIDNNNDSVDWDGGSIHPENVNVNVNRNVNVNQTTVNQANVNRSANVNQANVNQAKANRSANAAANQGWQPSPQAKAQTQARQQSSSRSVSAAPGVKPAAVTGANKNAQDNLRTAKPAGGTPSASAKPAAKTSDSAFAGAREGGTAARQESARGQGSRGQASAGGGASKSASRDGGAGQKQSRDRSR